MQDRSSRPKTSPKKTPLATTKRVVSLRLRLREGPVQLEQHAEASSPVLTESDLKDLPAPLADYIRGSRAVGKPRTTSFSANLHGRIRSAPDKALAFMIRIATIAVATGGEVPAQPGQGSSSGLE